MSVGARLRLFRERKGLTQAQLGGLLSVKDSTVSRMETGGMGVDARDIPKLAAILGVSPCDFFEEPAAEERTGRPFQLVGGLTESARREIADLVRVVLRQELGAFGSGQFPKLEDAEPLSEPHYEPQQEGKELGPAQPPEDRWTQALIEGWGDLPEAERRRIRDLVDRMEEGGQEKAG